MVEVWLQRFCVFIQTVLCDFNRVKSCNKELILLILWPQAVRAQPSSVVEIWIRQVCAFVLETAKIKKQQKNY